MGFVTSAPMCNNGTQGKFTSPWCFFGQLFGLFSAICPKMGRLSIQAGEESEIFLGIGRNSADAGTPFGGASAHKCYIEAHKCHKCSTDKKQEQKQEEEDDSNKGFITYFLEKVFGIK